MMREVQNIVFKEFNIGEVESVKFIGHYTSVHSFLSIIQNESVRFCHYNYMNDPMEGVFFKINFIKALESNLKRDFMSFSKKNKKESEKEIDDIMAGLRDLPRLWSNPPSMIGVNLYEEVEGLLEEYYSDCIRDCVGDSFYYDLYERAYKIGLHPESRETAVNTYYISSFSLVDFNDKSGNIPMWKIYGSDAGGVRLDYCLAESQEYFSKFYEENIFSSKVIYESEGELKYKITNLIDKIKYQYECKDSLKEKRIVLRDFLENMLISSFYIKDNRFSYEEEFRFSLCIEGVPAKERSSKFKVNFYERDGVIVPYIDVLCPNTYINRVVCGPLASQRKIDSIRRFLFDDDMLKTFTPIEESKNTNISDENISDLKKITHMCDGYACSNKLKNGICYKECLYVEKLTVLVSDISLHR